MRTVDHDQVVEMIKHGFTAGQIADRLGCTPRHVRRIAEGARLDFDPSPLIDTQNEKILWETCRSMGMKPAAIAYAFGRSRQAMYDYFSRPRMVSGGELL